MPPLPSLAAAQALHRAGRMDEAAAAYLAILERDPGRADVLLPLGLALRAMQRDAEALAAFDKARTADTSLAEAHHQAGNVLKRLGRWPEALAALQRATELAPANAAAWLNLGVTCLDSGRTDEAVEAFRRAVALEPRRAEAQNILGVALTAAGQLEAARSSLRQALAIRPDYAAAHNNLARIYKAEGLLGEAVEEYRAALANAADAGTHSNLLLALNYIPNLAPMEVAAEHQRWNRSYAMPLLPSAPLPPSWTPARRLRVGYVSPDFCHHAVAYFIAPVLAAHDRSRVEVFCYANVAAPDRHTGRLRGLVEHWRDIARIDDESAARMIRADGIDLLIDLAGHTARHRLLLFARRPAPVQVTWIGYPNTTGLTSIDYRLTDGVADPVGHTEALHSETLIRLPETFCCYEPDPQAPAVNPLPAREPGVVTFGCFNNFAKISAPVIALWGRLMQRLPQAKLLLKSRGLADPAVTTRVRAAFAEAGVAADRIAFNGVELPVASHLALYHGVDIALDPFPYNGTTTTCEALWMGVPVLTLEGRVHAGRVGTSLLTHLGLADWIAATPDEYVARAVSAASDLPALAKTRVNLRQRMRCSPLCDAPRFTRGLEASFARMALSQTGNSADTPAVT